MRVDFNEDLQAAAAAGRLGDVEIAIAKGGDPKADNSRSLWKAAENGHLEVVRILLSISDSIAANSIALARAAENGHLEVVKLLLPLSDPTAGCSRAISRAAENGRLEVVRLLLPLYDQKTDYSATLRMAAAHGHLEVVKLLLPVSDATASDFWAIRMAATRGCLEIVMLLLPQTNVAAVLGNPEFTSGSGCDLFLSCIPPDKAGEFAVAHPELPLPRTRAMLASEGLRQRAATRPDVAARRRRA